MKPISKHASELSFAQYFGDIANVRTEAALRCVLQALDEWQASVEGRLGQEREDPEKLKVRISNLEWMNENLRENNRALLATNESLRDVVAKLSSPAITVGGPST